MSNIYYQPADFGLEIVAEIEYSDGNYVFDTRVVWKEIKGRKFYTARDSGCSCPTPFEDCNLSNIDLLDFDELRREVNEESAKEHECYINAGQAQEFLAQVRAAKSRKAHE